MRCVIFDLDGTLADTSRDLINAANSCFSALGLGDPLDPILDASTAFRGGRAMLTLGFSRVEGNFGQADIDRQYTLLLSSYGENIDQHTRLYPGAVDAIERLRHAGYAVGICTNKPEGLAETLMTRLNVRDLFGSLVGADTFAQRKPDAVPYRAAVKRAGGAIERSLLVGDTETDHKTSRNAGVASVLVTFGPDGHTVADLKPDALLHSYDDLDDVVSGLIG